MGTQVSSAISENDVNQNKMQKEFLLSMSSQNPNNAQPLSNDILTIPKNVTNFVLISSGSTNFLKSWKFGTIFVCGFSTSDPPIPQNYYHLHTFKDYSLCTIHLGAQEYAKAVYYMNRSKTNMQRTEFLKGIISLHQNNEEHFGDLDQNSNQRKPEIHIASPTDPNVGENSRNRTLTNIPSNLSNSFDSNSYHSSQESNRSIPTQQSDKLRTLSDNAESDHDDHQEIQDVDEDSNNVVSVSICNSSQSNGSNENAPQTDNKASNNKKKPKKEKKHEKNQHKKSSQPKKNPQSNELASQSGQKKQNKQLSSQTIEEEYDEDDNSDKKIKKQPIDLISSQTSSGNNEEANSNQKSANSTHQDKLDSNSNNSSPNKNGNYSARSNNGINSARSNNENYSSPNRNGNYSARSNNGINSSLENSPIERNSMSKMERNRPDPLPFVVPKTGEELLNDNDKPQPNRKLNTISPSRLPSNKSPLPNMCKLTIKITALEERDVDLSFKEEEEDKEQFQFTPANNEDNKNTESKSDAINSESEKKLQQETKPQLEICDTENVSKSCEKGPIYINREVIELDDTKDEKIVSSSLHFTTPNDDANRQPIQLSEPVHYHYENTETVKKAPLVIAHKVIIDRYHKQRPIEICHMVEISKYTNEPVKKKQQHQPKIIDKIAQLEDAACQRGIQAQLDSNVDFVIPSSEFMSSSHQKKSKHKSKQGQNTIPVEIVNYSSDLSQKEEQLMKHMEKQRIHKSPNNHSHGSRKHSHQHIDSESTSSHFTETVKQNAAKKILEVHKKASQIAFDDSTTEKVMSTESYFDVDKKDIVPPSPKFISPSKKDRDTDVDKVFDDVEQSSELFRPGN